MALISFGVLAVGFPIMRIEDPVVTAGLCALVDVLPVFGVGTVLVPWAVIEIIGGNYALGFGLAVLYGGRGAWKWKMSLDGMTDVLIWGTIFGIIGARIYYVAFMWDYYSEHLTEIPMIHHGGIAIYGGIIGALIGAAIGCKIGKKYEDPDTYNSRHGRQLRSY